MTNKQITATEMIERVNLSQKTELTFIKSGNINSNIAFEVCADKADNTVQHLFIVEYKPSTDDVVYLEGHGLLNSIESDVELRIRDLKEVYEDVAYEVGDKVEFVEGRYKGVPGEIVEVMRAYKEIDSDGYHFAPDGLLTIEGDIHSIALEYEFDGYTLNVHHPEQDLPTMILKAYTRVASFWSYYYVVKAATKDLPFNIVGENMRIGITHHGLKKTNQSK